MHWNGGSLPQLNKNLSDKWYIPLYIEHKEEQHQHISICAELLFLYVQEFPGCQT
jgi:hypothetical protein